jgi:hypothetical protein
MTGFEVLYKALPDGLFNDAYGRALEKKKANPARVFRLDRDLKLLDYIDDEDKRKFLVYAGMAYLIPLDLFDGTIYGFIVRNVETKNFMKVPINENYPFFIGFEDFETFQKDYPIVLCEGIKDKYATSLVYPYSLGYLTAKISDDLWTFVNKLSNNIIINPDNDGAGIKNIINNPLYKNNKKYFAGTKDSGEYFDKLDRNILIGIYQHLLNAGVPEGLLNNAYRK